MYLGLLFCLILSWKYAVFIVLKIAAWLDSNGKLQVLEASTLATVPLQQCDQMVRSENTQQEESL